MTLVPYPKTHPMRTYLYIGTVALGLLASCSNPTPPEAVEEKPEIAGIFQSVADNWFQEGEGSWSFNGDELVALVDSQEGFLMTNARFQNFILELEFHPDSTINSGVFLRCSEHIINDKHCYEVNIWDLRPEQNYRTGSIVGLSEPLAHIETIDRWNSYKMQCEGDRIQVWLNDTLTADHHDPTFAEGHIGLQAHGTGEIRFRNVNITRLD